MSSPPTRETPRDEMPWDLDRTLGKDEVPRVAEALARLLDRVDAHVDLVKRGRRIGNEGAARESEPSGVAVRDRPPTIGAAVLDELEVYIRALMAEDP